MDYWRPYRCTISARQLTDISSRQLTAQQDSSQLSTTAHSSQYVHGVIALCLTVIVFDGGFFGTVLCGCL